MAGITAAGLTIKTLQEILLEMQTSQRAKIHPAIDTSTARPLGQLNGITAEQISELWELLRVAFNAFDPDAAEDFLLDALSAITGTIRRAESRSLVDVTVSLNSGTTLPQGSIIGVPGQETGRFRSREVFGPAPSTGTYSVQFESVETGPVVANTGTLTDIVTPVSGWNSATNPSDASLGRYRETDAELRLRRFAALSAAGACTWPALLADLTNLDGVVSVKIFENLSGVTDLEGLPSKSFEALIYDGDSPAASDAEIAETIWENKPAGIRTWGSTTTQHVEPLTEQSFGVRYSRPTFRNVYLTYSLLIDPVKFPLDGVNDVKELVSQTLNRELLPGDDLIVVRLKCLVYEQIPGVLDVTDLRLGFSASPTNQANLVVGSHEKARLDTSRITVNTTS